MELTLVQQADLGDVEGLALRARDGDRAAFDQLYARCVGRVYALCLRMGGSAEEAERLTQDAFVRVWMKLGTFRGESAFTSWLHRLVVNLVLEDQRATARREARVGLVEDPTVFDRGASADPSLRMDLEQAIARLPTGARTALVLHDVEGLRHEEIARLHGVAVGTIKAQLHRARRLLREMLER